MFKNGYVKILLDNVYYGSGYLLSGFLVLDIVTVFINDDTSIYVVGNSSISNDVFTWEIMLSLLCLGPVPAN